MDFTEILRLLMQLLVLLLTGLLLPYLRRKVGMENWTQAVRYVAIFVRAAEQLFDTQEGNQKKQYVLDHLKQKGIQLDSQAVDAMIEAAVLEVHRALPGAASKSE